MTTTLAVILLILALVAYIRARSYIAPTVISPASWGLVLLMFGLLDHGMQDISNNVLVVIGLWNISLFAGAWLFSEIPICKDNSLSPPKIEFNKSIRTIYFWIAVLGTIPLMYIAYKQVGGVLGGNIFLSLRLANTGIVENEYNYGIWQYAFVFAFISFLIELFSYKEGGSKKRIYIIFLVNILQAIITMAKSSFFFLFLSVIFSIMFRRKIATRYLAASLSVLILLMTSLQVIRSSDSQTDNIVSDMFYIYVLGGVPALDEAVKAEMRSKNWGQSTMRFFRNVATSFGAKPLQEESVNDITEKGYVFVPLPTNVFTVIGPFWWDFGYWGVGIFSFIIGAMSGSLYRMAMNKKLWAVIAYSYIACTLVLQFFGEYIFTNLSYTIQIILLTLLAYKFNYTFKWR